MLGLLKIYVSTPTVIFLICEAINVVNNMFIHLCLCCGVNGRCLDWFLYTSWMWKIKRNGFRRKKIINDEILITGFIKNSWKENMEWFDVILYKARSFHNTPFKIEYRICNLILVIQLKERFWWLNSVYTPSASTHRCFNNLRFI